MYGKRLRFPCLRHVFDVHAAIGRHRAAAGADADRFSDIWRTKQLDTTWTLTLAGHYVDSGR